MDTIVVKFGGSSVADNEKLKIVADKIIKLYDKDNNIVVVVSAQGKTTDKLIKEAKELSNKPNKRELDSLLSVGEQISATKLAILLKELGYEAISFTGWQAGIHTNEDFQNSKIGYIDISTIIQELKMKKIVVVTGFQGIDDNNNITTLGRGGSDTTAVALATELNAKKCYIYSDVDGIYSADPNKIPKAQKLKNISYEEMQALSNEGAKVLHDRCVEIADRNKVTLITGSTFNDNPGTHISTKLESSGVKSIVKKDVSRISVVGYGISSRDDILTKIMEIANKNHLEIFNIDISRTKITIVFKELVNNEIFKELHDVLII